MIGSSSLWKSIMYLLDGQILNTVGEVRPEDFPSPPSPSLNSFPKPPGLRYKRWSELRKIGDVPRLFKPGIFSSTTKSSSSAVTQLRNISDRAKGTELGKWADDELERKRRHHRRGTGEGVSQWLNDEVEKKPRKIPKQSTAPKTRNVFRWRNLLLCSTTRAM